MTNTLSKQTNHSQLSCIDVLNEAVAHEPGIMKVSLNPQARQMLFDYDPAQVTPPQIEQVAQHVSPFLEHNLENCVIRLAKNGGSTCNSCTLTYEGQMGHLNDNHRQASADYTSGVLSITYDGYATASSNQLVQRLRPLGQTSTADFPPTAATPASDRPDESMFRQVGDWLGQRNWEAIFMVITLVTMIAGWLVTYFEGPAIVATIMYVIAYATGGWFGLQGGIESLRERTIDVDLLMVLAALGAAYVGAPFEGAMLLFLFSLSNVLQDYAMDRTRNAIRSLMKLRPNQAVVRRQGQETTLPIEEITLEDTFIVKPGDRIALDGVVIKGESAVDQAAITGESMPVAKTIDDAVLAGTINKNGHLEVRVTKLAQDSTIAKMIKLVEEAQSEKAHTQRFLDTAEQYYAMGVIGFTLLAILIPIYLLGEGFDSAFYRAMTIMVAASPCALIISTPAAILSAIGAGARKGVLFKGGVYMEQAASIKVVAFDKTGTLTAGTPQVTDVKLIASEQWAGDENDLLALAATIQTKSEHALGKATVAAAKSRQLELSEALAFQAATGKGVQGQVDGQDIRIGNLRYFETFDCVGLEAASVEIIRLQSEGKTSVVVAQIIDNQTAHILGVVAFADKLRPDAAAVVQELKSLGVKRVVMLTGDNEQVAQAIAQKVGVDEFYADLLPEDKVRLVKELEAKYGSVAMVGDGVNDAPALASASIGMAMGAAGTDVALETADIVLLSDELSNIPYTIALSRQTRKTLVVNLGFALAMIVIMIAGIFAINLPLPLVVIGHEGGTVLVSLNGLRLLLYKWQPQTHPTETGAVLKTAPV